MAHLLSAHELAYTAAHRPILAGVSVSLADGARVGIVGSNGAGKTTLLRLLARTLEPDSGFVAPAATVRMAMVGQADELAASWSVREAIHHGAADYEWARDSHIRRIHAGLLGDIDLSARVGELSGGQARRVALARALCVDANVLLLDEPTNHLDIDGITFLAEYLSERFGGPAPSGALVAVTHDRWFLDATCTRMWEVVPGDDGPGGRAPRPGHVETYEGGYAAYILARAERERVRQATEAKRQNILRKELAWLRRGAPARTSKPRFRIEAAEALIANEPAPRDTVELTKLASARLGKDVIHLEDVCAGYDDNEVLHDVTLRLGPGERLGILGPNGAGKSTLLGLMTGRIAPTRGRVKRGKTVQLAELSQHTGELDEVAHLRVVEAVADVAQRVPLGKGEITASQLTERLGFTRERAWTRVAELSGGERRRLQLMRLLMGQPNVLILDEPTNDLDTDTLAAVEDVLDSWAGTLIVVSHDRYLLERVSDHQVAVLDGTVRDVPGGVDEYVRLRHASQGVPANTEAGAGREQGKAQPRASEEGGAGVSVAARERQLRKDVARLERQMDKERAKAARWATELESANEAGDYERLTEISEKIRGAEDAIADLEEQWLAVAQALENVR